MMATTKKRAPDYSLVLLLLKTREILWAMAMRTLLSI
jgi:hypothetical protein